jgi:hypothetical protein
MMNEINYNLCLCRRSSNSLEQCKNKRKYGEYCGVHIKCYNKTGRIDEPLKKNIVNLNEIDLNNYINYNIHNLSMSDMKKLSKNFNINIKKIKRKKVLYDTIMGFFKGMDKVSGNPLKIKKIIKLQSILKTKYIQNIFGFPNINRRLSSNKIDINGDIFWENNGKDITINTKLKAYDIFGFYENNIGYCFTIEGFQDNMKHYGKNPYTCQKFSQKIINNFNQRILYIKNNINHKTSKINKYTVPRNKRNKFRAIRLFQIIDTLGNYTDYKWFMNLSLNRLKLMYFCGKDIWNYQYTDIYQKKKILPPRGVAFQENQTRINSFRLTHKENLQTLLLDQIENLITKGETEEHAKVGAWIVLTCLVKASREAQRALPYYV